MQAGDLKPRHEAFGTMLHCIRDFETRVQRSWGTRNEVYNTTTWVTTVRDWGMRIVGWGTRIGD